MPNSRSKYSEAAVNRRKSIARDVTFGVLIGLAVIFVIMAGRFIYGKSKDPNYRLAYLFGQTSAGTVPTLPTFPIDSFPVPSSSETVPETDGSSEDHTEDSTEGSEADTTEAPTEDTTEVTAEDTTEASTEETAEETTTEAETTESEPESTQPETTESETSTEESTEPTEISTEETTPEETPEETTSAEETTPEETTTEPVVLDPTDINSHLAYFNMDEKDLGDCRQLIVVHSSGTQCMLYFFDRENKEWALSNAIPSAPGVVGENGVTTDKKEGDGCTPAGYFALGPCYGEEADFATAMEYHQIVKGDYWVNDPDSELYNTFVHVDDVDTIEWAGGEDLYDLLRYYRYMVVIRCNMDPVVPGAGSTIFLRCQADETATAGCVSTKDATVFAILRWLSPEADPHILIY